MSCFQTVELYVHQALQDFEALQVSADQQETLLLGSQALLAFQGHGALKDPKECLATPANMVYQVIYISG